jgi:uncharacterized lipoprotein YddW (UPF0748 family)
MRPHLLLPSLAIGALCATAGLSSSAVHAADVFPLAELNPADETAARALWKPMEDSTPVACGDVDGQRAVKLRCAFKGTRGARASWDAAVRLDLTGCRGLQFRFHWRDLGGVSGFTLYLRSGAGWYRLPFGRGKPGWNTITVDKAATDIEGTPAGWHLIETIRLSAWRGTDEDGECAVADWARCGEAAPILLVRGESAAKAKGDEAKAVAEYAEFTGRCLKDLGIAHNLVSDLDLTPELLATRKLALLPHNPGMPDAVAETLAKWMQGGGKVIGWYSLPEKLRAAVGIGGGKWVGQKPAGYFDSIRVVADAGLSDVPPVVKQRSWNINEPQPVAGRSTVLAWWHNDKGERSAHPAIVGSANCIHMSHVLLPDDQKNKRLLLLAMLAHFLPEARQQAAQAAIERIGRCASFGGFEDLERATKALNPGAESLAALEQAAKLRTQAREKLAAGNTAEAFALADSATAALVRAFALAQKPLAGEHRGIWCHRPFGIAGQSWDETIKQLAANGFTAILPNMLWGGSAAYPSQVLPLAPQTQGDCLAECLAACRRYGVQCHVWKVNWNTFWKAPPEFLQKIKQEGRGQAAFDGKQHDEWLCPSHPENQKLEIEAMVEIAMKYDVDGVHFDYIRYPGPEYCFCKGCRERFEKSIGAAVANWPADVRRDPLQQKWNDFRRENITKVVAGVAERLRKDKPKVKISAAVFQNWPRDRDGVGQDWKLWCEKGWLDFVCPMDYLNDDDEFESIARQQTGWAGKVPCYPGIGLSCWPASGSDNAVQLIEQIGRTRKAKTGGFTVFELNAREAQDVLPLSALGATRKE